jgi:hypothetical protein
VALALLDLAIFNQLCRPFSPSETVEVCEVMVNFKLCLELLGRIYLLQLKDVVVEALRHAADFEEILELIDFLAPVEDRSLKQ